MRALILSWLLLICAGAQGQTPSNATNTASSSAAAPVDGGPITFGPVTITGYVRTRF